MQKLNAKYITVTCPLCKKSTRGPGFKMLQAYSKAKFAGMDIKQIAYFLSVTPRYVRELLDDFPSLCEHCHQRLIPGERDWRILKLGWAGATQVELSNVFGLSEYEIQQIQNRWRCHPCIALEEFVFSRKDYPDGWFPENDRTANMTNKRFDNMTTARHPYFGHAHQRDGENEDE